MFSLSIVIPTDNFADNFNIIAIAIQFSLDAQGISLHQLKR
jgi:hypothetical protein